MDYTDLQLGAPLIDTSVNPPTVVLAVENAGEVELSGLEAELLYRPFGSFTINLAVSTLDVEVVSLDDDNALLYNCANPLVQTFETCEAQDIARAPALQYTAGALQIFSLRSGAELNFSANYEFVDEQESSSSAANSVRLDEYGVLNLRAQFTPPSGNWSVAMFGTNVTDEYYYTTGGNLTGFYGTRWAAPGRPAEYGVELKAKF